MGIVEDFLGKTKKNNFVVNVEPVEDYEQRERRLEEVRRCCEESIKRCEYLSSHPLKSMISDEGIRTHDSEGNSSVTYPSLDNSDAVITYYNNDDGSRGWKRKERRKDGSVEITKSDGSWEIIE